MSAHATYHARPLVSRIVRTQVFYCAGLFFIFPIAVFPAVRILEAEVRALGIVCNRIGPLVGHAHVE